jgi:hypothetical protein
MKNKVGWIIGGVAAIFIGYVVYLKYQAEKLMNLTYRIQKFKILNAGLNNFRFNVELALTNPSNVDFTLNDYDIDIAFQNTPITKIKGQNINITIPSNQSVALPLDVQFDPRTLGQNILQVFLDSFILNPTEVKGTKIRYSGTVSGKFGALGFKNIPIDYTYEM